YSRVVSTVRSVISGNTTPLTLAASAGRRGGTQALEGGDVPGVTGPALGRRLHDQRYARHRRVRDQLCERGLAEGTGAHRLVPVPGRAAPVLGVVRVHQ